MLPTMRKFKREIQNRWMHPREYGVLHKLSKYDVTKDKTTFAAGFDETDEEYVERLRGYMANMAAMADARYRRKRQTFNSYEDCYNACMEQCERFIQAILTGECPGYVLPYRTEEERMAGCESVIEQSTKPLIVGMVNGEEVPLNRRIRRRAEVTVAKYRDNPKDAPLWLKRKR